MSDIASYITGLRARGIAVADLDDTAVTAIAAEALYEFSRQRPILATKVFDTIADQQVYTWTEIGDADGITALDVLWSPFSVGDEWSMAHTLATIGIPRDPGYWHLPSLAVVDQIKMAAHAHNWGGSGYQIDDVAGSVYLTPTPEQAGIDVWVIYTKAHAAVTTIKSQDRDLFLDLLEAMCSERMVKELAAKAAVITVKTPDFEMQVGAKIGVWRANAREKRQSFISKCEAGKAACART